jgi:hypothetical protein
MELDHNKIDRILLAIMEKHKCEPEEAMARLNSLKLNIDCGKEVESYKTYQAALLTAVNAGCRAFHGGVKVNLSKNIKCFINWPGIKYLYEAVEILGGIITSDIYNSELILSIGQKGSITQSYKVIANGWQGGFLIPEDYKNLNLTQDLDFCLGGIAAASLAVGLIFMKETSIDSLSLLESKGISLWRPDLPWYSNESIGPIVSNLPKNFWLMGLGHLGQGYIWNAAFLPFENKSDVTFFLQDSDFVVDANLGAGLLLNKNTLGNLKSRVCSKFLEQRSFRTKLVERKLDEFFKVNRNEKEPLIALCGFDNISSRLFLKDAGFNYVVNCGLGGTLDTFDDIIINSLPNEKIYKYWVQSLQNQETNVNESSSNAKHDNVRKILDKISDDKCGILNIASVAISTSFVGALAGSFAIADLIRGLNDGKRYLDISYRIRGGIIQTTNSIEYENKLIPNGYVSAC